jgi:peptide/nickel transport system substrate-binding protein
MKWLRNASLAAVVVSASMLLSPLSLLAQDTVVCETYTEAPMLAERVAAGELPPIAERLPVNPLVVTPYEGNIGQFGGAMNDLYNGSRLAEFRQYGYESLVRWNVDGSAVIPNIAESWEISDEGRTYTFKLREGMKWSDGQPFTTDDILFWWDYVETNAEIRPSGPYPYFVVNGEAATVTQIDPLTFSFSWSEPNGLFLQNLSASYGVRITQFPRHYMEQFSKDLNPDNVAALMAAAGETEYGRWWNGNVGSYGSPAEYNDPNRPTLQPWYPVAPYIGAERFTLARNPYYFKVDPACNQLPYIDERVFTLVTDPEVALLATIQGQDYMSDDAINTLLNRAVFFDNQETGNYRFINSIDSNFNTMQLHIKYNSEDPVKAQIFQDINFRIGLSQAMDRQTIIDTVYLGQGRPFQQSPRPESPLYNERLATQYTGYDVAAANAALDMVMPDKDADGFRLRPDGERFVFTVVVNGDFRSEWVDVMQFVERNWEEVGIDVIVDAVTDDVWRERAALPQTDAFVWVGENGLGLQPLLAARDSFTPEAAYGWLAWNAKRLNPDAETAVAPVEPPAGLQRQYELVDLIQASADPEQQVTLMAELLELSAEGFYTIGLSLPEGGYRVVNNALQNVPETLLAGWLYPGPAPANFETFFIDPTQVK